MRYWRRNKSIKKGNRKWIALFILNPQWQMTEDKREIKDFPKLPSATSFIRKQLGDILLGELFLKYNERKEDGLK